MAAAITGGEVELVGARLDHGEALAEKLTEAGARVVATDRGVTVRAATDGCAAST